MPKFESLFAAFDAKRQQENAVPVQVHALVCPILVLVCPTRQAAPGERRARPGTFFFFVTLEPRVE